MSSFSFTSLGPTLLVVVVGSFFFVEPLIKLCRMAADSLTF